ncbi:unnamed protein product [Periconia digitata]|uniref:Uncharacterized protein n=1 Tax=Periconia digitata TaxID=1303443 RepID=A0A9W4UFH2_9PLEO|nr:unnamed protein product [Periconia digitata]
MVMYLVIAIKTGPTLAAEQQPMAGARGTLAVFPARRPACLAATAYLPRDPTASEYLHVPTKYGMLFYASYAASPSLPVNLTSCFPLPPSTCTHSTAIIVPRHQSPSHTQILHICSATLSSLSLSLTPAGFPSSVCNFLRRDRLLLQITPSPKPPLCSGIGCRSNNRNFTVQLDSPNWVFSASPINPPAPSHRHLGCVNGPKHSEPASLPFLHPAMGKEKIPRLRPLSVPLSLSLLCLSQLFPASVEFRFCAAS